MTRRCYSALALETLSGIRSLYYRCIYEVSKTDLRKSRQNQRGATTVLFTFVTFLVLMPVMGLAIDGSIVMWVKSRLATAVDAAALAAGRSLSITASTDQSPAVLIGQNYFAANFQPGHMGTTVTNPGGLPVISLGQDSSARRTITVQANVNVPLYFLRLLSFKSASLQAVGQASRKDVNVILVLDRSGSMDRSGSCGPMVAAAQSFVNMFVEGRDSVGLITFQLTANIDVPSSTTFKANATASLNQLVCSGGTNSAWGLSLAYDEIKRLNLQGASNVVVFYSDGWPSALRFSAANGYNAALPTRNQTSDDNDTRYQAFPNSSEAQFLHSNCVPNSISGVLEAFSQVATPTGDTLGILNDTQYGISSSEGAQYDASHLVPASGCTYNNPPSAYANSPAYFMRQDVAYLPEIDYYGNPTGTTLNPLGPQPYLNTLRFPNDGVHYYPGKLRPDSPQTLTNAAFIAADNVAYTIRQASQFHPIIYTIGLGSDVNDDFMERLANDPAGSSYDKSKPAGLYIKAPTSSQLQAAFQQIASQVLRISQ